MCEHPQKPSIRELYFNARDLFKLGHYREALENYRRFEDSRVQSGPDKQRSTLNEFLIGKSSKGQCILALLKSDGKNSELEDEFLRDLDVYLAEVPAEGSGLANHGFVRYFATVADFFFLVQPLDSYKKLSWILKKLRGKVRSPNADNDFFSAWVEQISMESRNFASDGFLQRTEAMINVFLDETGGVEGMNEIRMRAFNILADLNYYSPAHNCSDVDRFKKIDHYLECSLKEVPRNMFALKLKEHLKAFTATSLQIRRFNHDANSRIANIKNLAQRITSHIASDSPIKKDVLQLEYEIGIIDIIGNLVKKSQPARGDWKLADIRDIVEVSLRRRGISTDGIKSSGDRELWEFCPQYLELMFENLLRNSEEAYERQKIPIPEIPIEISIDYSCRLLSYRDFAGGVDPALGDIFEPYKSSKGSFDTSGLGLTQARQVMESQGFLIGLYPSQPSGGALFVLDFNNRNSL
ncbi:MAG: HAMP domain-containing histidine kinase [Candidatus Riflebacteria bacterium]|nr:HAMP domain-containing histidine kinase [Candidatus Riflebacteria bacterium]